MAGCRRDRHRHRHRCAQWAPRSAFRCARPSGEFACAVLAPPVALPREMVCHMTWVLRRRRLPGAPLTSCITSGGTSDRAYVCLAHPVKGAILFARRRIARQHIARRRAKSLRAYRWPNLVKQLALADFRALVAGAATAGARLLPVGQRCGARSRAFGTRISRTRGCPTCITSRLALPARARSQHSVRAH